MRRLLWFTIFLIAATGCGSKRTVASKSAAAYRDAVQKGAPISSGGHGGHEHGAATTGGSRADSDAHGMTAEDHVAMGDGAATQEHAAMGHDTATRDYAPMGHGTATQEHAAMSHDTATQDHAAMGHGTATQDHVAMGHGTATQEHAAMGHGTATQDHVAMGAQAGAHAGHASASEAIPPGGLWGAVPGSIVNPTSPDAPAPIAVEEAKKAAGSEHEGHL